MPDLDPKDFIRQEARAVGLPEQFALGVAEQESGFRSDKDGEEFELRPGVKTRGIGMFQIIPETFRRYNPDPRADPRDPVQNVRTGVRYLKALWDEHGGDPNKILQTYGGVKRDTTYVPAVMQRVLRYQGEQPGASTSTTPAVTPVQRAQPPQPATTPAAGGPPLPPSFLGRWADKLGLSPLTYPGSRQPMNRADVPPDVLKQWDELHQHDDSGSLADIVKSSNAIGGVKATAKAYDPRERQGRRNIAGTAAAIAATPALIAAAPAALAGSFLVPVIAGAIASGAGGVVEEGGEQAVEAFQGKRTAPDLGAVASAGGQQAAQDVLGHAILAPARFALRATAGPGVAREVSTGLAAERERLGTFFQDSIDTLSQAARDLRFKFAGDKAAQTAATEAAVDLARRRAAEALAAGEASTARNVGRVKETGAQEIDAARAQAASALEQSETLYQQDIGLPPSETAAGQRAVRTLEGPAKEEVDALGQALDAVKRSGPAQDISAIQDEARRLVQEEILPPARTFPREAPTPPGSPPPPPPGIDPQLGLAITDAEREAIAKHPAMATINRLVNAPRSVSFKDLADLETELGSAADFTSPVASKVEGARKHLWQIIREQLGTHEPYDAAAQAYAEGRARLTTGYGAAAAKIGDIEPARIIQAISPNDPLQTATLMRNLTTHSPEAARAVQDTWLYRNVLQGGLDGLGQRIKVLRDRPEFARALFGGRLPSTLQRYEQLATGWDRLVASGEQAVSRTETETAKDLAAAKTRSAARETKIGTLGDAGVEAAQRQGKTLSRAEAATQRVTIKRVQDDLVANRISKRAASEISDQEALAMGKAQSRAQQVVDLILARGGPRTTRGVVGLVRLLSGPSSADLLKIAAGRPEVSQALVNWMASPDAEISYRVVKRLLGQEVQKPAGAVVDNLRGLKPPTIGGTPLYTVASPPPAPPGR